MGGGGGSGRGPDEEAKMKWSRNADYITACTKEQGRRGLPL